MSISSLLPDAEQLLGLEPEELGGILLEYLLSQPETVRHGVNRYNFSLPHFVEGYPPSLRDSVSVALMEAWAWLEREGLLVQKPSSQGWLTPSRRALKMIRREHVEAYRRAAMVPKHLLHPQIANRVWASFLRGDYDAAVLLAFKELEVAIRQASGLTADDFGLKLVKKAFHPESGTLTDKTVPMAEREATLNLFTGAIGLFKNPQSHRHVALSDPKEAMEMLVLASHLMRITERQSPADAS